MVEFLTNESLKGVCKSNFELAHYAIELARYYIKSGKEAHLSDILKDVKRHSPKYLEELKEIDRIESNSDNDEDANHS